MINYILAAFFTALGVLTISSNLQTSELVVGLVWFTMAALIVANRWQYEQWAHDLLKKDKPVNNWPTETSVYDWSKDQEGTL
jgi:hypothetical protein